MRFAERLAVRSVEADTASSDNRIGGGSSVAASSLSDGAAQLRAAIDVLERAWAATEDHWDDVVRDRFEAERLEPLRKQLSLTVDAIQQTGDVLNAARRHCRDADRDEA
jgi:hypothetical protein